MAKENLDIVNPNPLVDTSETTTDAYIKLKDKGLVTSTNPNKILGETDTQWDTSPNFKAQVYVYTPLDKQYHRYWTSMNIDVQVQDFMERVSFMLPMTLTLWLIGSLSHRYASFMGQIMVQLKYCLSAVSERLSKTDMNAWLHCRITVGSSSKMLRPNS